MSSLLDVTYLAAGLRMPDYVGSNGRNWLEGTKFIIWAEKQSRI